MMEKVTIAADEKRTVLDLFAGCGGLSKGFEMAGFEVAVANDVWEPAAATYRRNHPSTRFVLGDITDAGVRNDIYSAFEGKACDVIVGGPPCQAYSMSGLRNPDDPRAHLFENYVDMVRRLKPKVFVMENVKGILTMEVDRDDLGPEETGRLNELKSLEETVAALVLKRKQSKNTDRIEFTDERDALEVRLAG